jgi:hypothetical protein
MRRGFLIHEVKAMEVWKKIPNYSQYEASSLGRIRRAPDAVWRRATKQGRVLSGSVDRKTGYVRLTLPGDDGLAHREQGHRLVARTFLGEHRAVAHINHKDGNKTNNCVDNLEWCTQQENVRHAWRIGLCSPQVGSDHGGAKLEERDIRVIRDADERCIQLSIIAKVFNVSLSTVSSIVRNKTWRHVK